MHGGRGARAAGRGGGHEQDTGGGDAGAHRVGALVDALTGAVVVGERAVGGLARSGQVQQHGHAADSLGVPGVAQNGVEAVAREREQESGEQPEGAAAGHPDGEHGAGRALGEARGGDDSAGVDGLLEGAERADAAAEVGDLRAQGLGPGVGGAG
ncbi:hypothetical protein BJF83_05000 [Nocardiopsis sp. CNR-923]|uniref:hypothetical protein n=1 Tax=Nocardiopsis sp. CNR-923 TaxID=1904965 RepID=UPI000959918E|nr:hypothetical protein [Nocardiopsis sp. CNR-923]OLT25533.1 hypothetical protein BJF83_05000 [Nocardiopsis sp. CNR-923]